LRCAKVKHSQCSQETRRDEITRNRRYGFSVGRWPRHARQYADGDEKRPDQMGEAGAEIEIVGTWGFWDSDAI
jgi:hypothetical protein